MATIDFEPEGTDERGRSMDARFVVTTESSEDVAVANATFRATQGAREGFVSGTPRICLITTPNLMALWATEFEWTPAAYHAALGHLIEEARKIR